MQSKTAEIMIVALNTVIPAAFCVVQYVLLRKFDLEDKMAQIQADLAERRGRCE